MWIARDKSGAIYLYEIQPYRGMNMFISANGDNAVIYLGEKEVYSEVTWENSPKKVELKIID